MTCMYIQGNEMEGERAHFNTVFMVPFKEA